MDKVTLGRSGLKVSPICFGTWAFGGEWGPVDAKSATATKGGLRREGDRLVRDASREWLRQGVDACLRAIRVDVIDLYQLHWPDPSSTFEETAATLAEPCAVSRCQPWPRRGRSRIRRWTSLSAAPRIPIISATWSSPLKLDCRAKSCATCLPVRVLAAGPHRRGSR